ncbi:alpha/beta hydrolase [Actinorhabdospora filicis]|uniref:Alpha/beta hydrolase n=1 Tax=Actinorhabdospora filicis TaxID=1785913 RepID=A0A9W6W9W2_9ACTN|nr:alpha/beta hydrolase [Actinorhabdospora filicis]GLZ77976.1 alpha/beta hydrolase [Actinorhabdospora filicis]
MTRPTIVLVHGAFADASSWDPVTRILQRRGFSVIAAANPLRGLTHDAGHVRAVLAAVPGPVVLAGHSYGGAVITNAATDAVTALVYVAAFAPDEGETAGDLDARFEGPATRITVGRPLPGPESDGPPNIELTVDPAVFGEMFAPDVDAEIAAALAAAQRPIALRALLEPSGPPAWRTRASHYVLATGDRMIPAAGQRVMAERAGATVTEVHTGHAAMLGDPETIADVIVAAAG